MFLHLVFRALDDWHKMVSEAKLSRDQKKQLQNLVQNRFQVSFHVFTLKAVTVIGGGGGEILL